MKEKYTGLSACVYSFAEAVGVDPVDFMARFNRAFPTPYLGRALDAREWCMKEVQKIRLSLQ